MIADFHSHILPGIDDGSRDAGESVAMLRAMAQQGVDCVVATPHFYPEQKSLDSFLRGRERAYEEMSAFLFAGAPSLRCGAEVAFFQGIGRSEQLDCLCIENTNLLLLEMPFRSWTKQDRREIEEILDKGFVPILAHTERYYFRQKDFDVFHSIIQLPLYLQMNAGALTAFQTRRKAFKIIDYGSQLLLGSDCHDLRKRYPNLSEGRKVLLQKYGETFLEELDLLSGTLLGN